MLILTFVPILDTQASVMGHKQNFGLALPELAPCPNFNSLYSSWTGSRSSTDLLEDRKRGAESEDEDEMDRGRCKKVKRLREEKNYDRNRFQVIFFNFIPK